MPVLNEADVLPFVLDHNRRQGIRVHALDGWSTDGSYEILRQSGVSVERFPEDGPAGEQVCRSILSRIEDLAERSDADWCMISDCDEWRRSPRGCETLAEGIARVDREGWNAIDFRVFAFFCTDAGWHGDPETYFRFYNETDLICRIPNAKAWKNIGRVDAVTHGGHLVQFKGRRQCPERWVMKHYPFRTPEQARAKIETRLKRRCHEEHRKGWGVHYDVFKPGFNFCWDAGKLREWPSAGFPVSESLAVGA